VILSLRGICRKIIFAGNVEREANLGYGHSGEFAETSIVFNSDLDGLRMPPVLS
jgi:hypothetical protein